MKSSKAASPKRYHKGSSVTQNARLHSRGENPTYAQEYPGEGMRGIRNGSSEGSNILSLRRGVAVAISVIFIYFALSVAIKDNETLLLFDDVLFAIASGLAAIGLLYGSMHSEGRSRTAWMVLALAQIAYAAGDMTWAVIEVGLHQNPFPSSADVLYLAFYPLFALGISLLPSEPLSSRERIKYLLDAGIVVVASVFIFWAFMIAPIIASKGEVSLSLLISIVYPIMDIVIFAALIELIFTRIGFPGSRPLFLLALGLVMFLIGDAIFSVQTQQGTYETGGLADTIYLISDVFLLLAGVLQAGSKPINQRTTLSAESNMNAAWAQYLPYFAIGVASFLLLWGYARTRFISDSIFPIFIAVMIGLAFIRQKVTLDERNELLKKTQMEIDERKRTEKALQESENTYRAIFENTGAATMIIEDNAIISLANSELERLSGYKKEDVEGKKSWTEFVVKEDLEKMLEQHILGRIDPSAALKSYESRIKDRNGHIKDILLYVDIIPGTKKSIASLLDITERKRAEEALRDSERELASIIEFLPDATLVIDKDKKIIAWNRAIEEMTGIRKDDMIGKGDYAYTIPFYGQRRMHLLDLIDLDDNDIASKYQYVRRKGTTLFAETYTPALYGGKGAYVWAIGAPLYDNKGNRIGAIESIRDITEFKKAERTLREQFNFLQQLIDSIPNPIFYRDISGVYLGCNKAFEVAAGYSRDKIVGHTLQERFPKEFANVYHESDKNPLQDNGVQIYETSIDYADGSRHTVELSEAAYSDTEGQLAGRVGIIFDITERKHMEIALKESKDYLDKIINSIGDPLFVKDRQHRMTLVNEAACRLWGRPCEEIIGKTAYDLFPSKESAEISWKNDEDVFNTGAELTTEETNTYTDRTLTVLVKKTPYTDNEGNQFLVGITRDITDRKQAEDRIIASLQEKEVLLKEIHHRVKNNLQVISALLSLQSSYLTDENLIKVFGDSQNRIKSMALVHESLYRSKDFGKVDFNEYINQLVSHLSQSYGDLAEIINFKVNSENVYLNINTAISCGMIINELVSNSFKHAFPDGRSGEVCIDLSSTNDGYRLVVSDNGIGIKGDLNIRESKTLGFRLIDTLVKQIDGEMRIDASRGFRAEINFKGLM